MFPTGNPYLLTPAFDGHEKINPATYLGGGNDFGPFPAPTSSVHIVSRNLTPDKTGRPAGRTFTEFRQILRTGVDLDHLHPTCSGAPNENCIPFPFNGAPGSITIGLRPEHLRFAEAGLPGRIAQTEPMGREILYVVETDLGYMRVLEHGASAAHAAGEPVKIGFSPDDSLVFDTASESLMTGARVHPPIC